MYWPVLALLAYVGINLFLLSRHENWRDEAQAWQIAKNLGLSLLSGLFLVWELLGSTELNPSIDVHISSSPSYNLYRISVGAQWAVDNALGIGLSDRAWKLVLAAAFVCLLLLLWLSWKEALILAGTWVIQVLMFTYVYLSSEQKAMLLFHELIFVLWLILDKNKGTARKSRRLQLAVWQTALVLLSLTASDGHAQAVLRDVKEPYSAGEAAAAYIRESVPEDAVLAAASDVAVFSTAAYLPERGIWYPVTGEQITFSVWNEERLETIEYDEMIRRVREQFPEAEDMYLICGGSNNISGLENYLPGLEEMFRQDAMLPEESVVIYYVRF